MKLNHQAVNIHILISDLTGKLEMKYLTVEHLSKTIDGVKVLDDISFVIGHEDKIAFVGSNGLSQNHIYSSILSRRDGA